MNDMKNCFGIFKNVRTAPWECLLTCLPDPKLPVDVHEIAEDMQIKLMGNSNVNLLENGETGASIYSEEQWFIIYDDLLPPLRVRYAVAHELGHIFLGQNAAVSLGSSDNRTSDKCLDREADMFAERLLMPSCVIYSLDLHSADEIAELCQVTYETAHRCAVRMKEMYRKGKFLNSDYEKRVCEHFRPFIEKKLAEKK